MAYEIAGLIGRNGLSQNFASLACEGSAWVSSIVCVLQ